MNQPLYKVAQEYMLAYDKMFADGEIPLDAIRDTLAGIQGEIEEKAINVAAMIRNIETDAERIKEAERSMTERRQRLEKRAINLREYLLVNLDGIGLKNIFTPEIEIKIKKCPPSVQIEANSVIPEQYIRTTVKKEPDKVLLKEALCKGEEIKGVSIQQKNKLDIK